MSTQAKTILGILGAIIIIGLIYWLVTKNNKGTSTKSIGTGTGIPPRTATVGGQQDDNGRFIKPVVTSTPRPINGNVMVQIGCEGKGYYNCNSEPSDCSQSSLSASGCIAQK